MLITGHAVVLYHPQPVPALLDNHPYPAASLPVAVNPDSLESVRRFVQTHALPSGIDGRFLFALLDEDDRFEQVALRHGLAGHRAPVPLQRCAGGVHLIELHAPSVNRVEYRFSVTDRSGVETTMIDPANPLTVRDPFAEKSVVTTAAYRAPSYVEAPAPSARGALDETTILGPLGKPWPTWIWAPPELPGAPRSEPLPVVMWLDGGDWLHIASARNILENLVSSGTIAPCRAVFLRPAERNEEYAANPRTAAALANDIPRQLAERMPWPDDARQRIAVGVSLGALCLLHAQFSQPDAFGGLVLQSGSFFQPATDTMETGYPHFQRICDFVSGTAKGACTAKPAGVRLYMTCGAGEENIVNNRRLAAMLAAQGFDLTFVEQPDAHNWTCWRDSVGAGLQRLLTR